MNEPNTARRIERAGWARPAAAAWLVFSAGAVLFYYRQVFNLLRLGPQAWVQDNHSLEAALRPLWRAFSAGELPGLPAALPDALARTGLGLLGLGVVLLAAQAIGAVVLRLVRLPLSGAEGLLFRTALGFGALAYLFLGLAAFGVFTPTWVSVLLLFSASGGVIWSAGRIRAFIGKSPAHRRPRHLRSNRLWMMITVLASGMALLAALAPEVEYDALWYHLWLPELWLAAGKPVDLVREYVALYPLTWELLFGGAAVVGGPVAAKLLHWICLPLGALLAGQFIRRFFPTASPWLAAAVFVTVPTVFWEATTAYIDLALALYVGLALYASLRYLETAGSPDSASTARGWLPAAVLSLGLALAIKHLALFVYVLLVPAVGLARWRAAGRWQAAVLPTLAFGAGSLILPLPWYLRAWLLAGNPFFPDLYSIFGAFPPERWSPITEAGLARFKARFGMGRSPLALLLLPWNVTMHAARFGGSLGPVFLLLVLPGAALFQRWRRPGSHRLFWALVGFAVGYLALWASPLSSFQLRFLVPLALVLAVLAAAAVPRLSALLRLGRLPSSLLPTSLALLLLLNLPPFLSLHEGDRQEYEGWLTHVHHTLPVGVVLGYESRPQYLGRVLPAYRAWRYINAHLPPDAYVLTFIGGDNLYGRRDRLASDATLAHPGVWGAEAGAEDQAQAYLRQLGITHVLVDLRQLPDFSTGSVPLLAPDAIPRWLDLLYEDQRAAVYALKAEGEVHP
jgi:hypothetical protein